MHWYAMYSKPNKEEFLYNQLRSREVTAYYPRINVRSANQSIPKQKPYFPRYLFIRAELEEIGSSILKWTPGAVGLVEFDYAPAVVPDEVIDTIRWQVDRINASEKKMVQNFKQGDLVEIQSGPFAKYRAIFDSHLSGQQRVRVLLQMLNDRQLIVELSAKQIDLLI